MLSLTNIWVGIEPGHNYINFYNVILTSLNQHSQEEHELNRNKPLTRESSKRPVKDELFETPAFFRVMEKLGCLAFL